MNEDSSQALTLYETTKNNLKNLETYEDYLSYYVTLDETSTAVAWMKADMLLDMNNKMGFKSIAALARDIAQSYHTVTHYIRVAKAFPPRMRNPSLSFSHHYHASYADSYDEKKGGFSGGIRFLWIQKAADKALSANQLRELVKEDKTKRENGVYAMPCHRCGKMKGVDVGDTKRYILYEPGTNKKGYKFYLHKQCLKEIVEFANAKIQEEARNI